MFQLLLKLFNKKKTSAQKLIFLFSPVCDKLLAISGMKDRVCQTNTQTIIYIADFSTRNRYRYRATKRVLKITS